MAADSVEYHRKTVLQRGDDHPGRALAYYASRGETPLTWGGSGAERLGLVGAVTDGQYEAIYGPGGAKDALLGDRLVRTRRPGMELVISAHKSVAELGVIGRVEDMHTIMDAERDATLEYLDTVTKTRGARRGRSQTPVATSGLVYAVTRHATSRAGDPSPHDHVLLANIVETLDGVGGWKAADTNVWRDELHAATVVGRMAAARVAVELGYGIERDDGMSGRLGHWRIKGIPDEVVAIHSKRSAEITAAVNERGVNSYQARSVAARTTRDVKRHTPVDDLLPAWQEELAEVGWPVKRLQKAVKRGGIEHRRDPSLNVSDTYRLIGELTGMDGPLSRLKVFTRSDITVAVAPHLYGRPFEDLSQVVDKVIASRDVIPLLAVAGARQRCYSTAVVIATEQAVEDLVARGIAAHDGPQLPTHVVDQVIQAKKLALGSSLTSGQARAVRGICTDGHMVSLVLGVAGSGKTTALDCVRDAYEQAGYTVVGTATSGQAARTLGQETGVESRTIASLLWRLDHRTLELDAKHVLFVDEAGMTDDRDLHRLLVAANACDTKVVLVGDHRQLGAVGPGGALEAVIARNIGSVHYLTDNVRQQDPAERKVLSHLRDGNIPAAVRWYAEHDRIAVSADRDTAIDQMADAWLADALSDMQLGSDLGTGVGSDLGSRLGSRVGMYAWQRSNVEALNQAARARWEHAGRLEGPEMEAPGGRRYRSGDRIVTLAPGGDGQIVTSERGTVLSVDRASGELVARMDDQRRQMFTREETGRDRLAHGYAVTVHRSQGATVDVAHHLADGGGRELAYVAMSRARERTTVHVVADDLAEAVEDLNREWAREARPRWAVDTGIPVRVPEPAPERFPTRTMAADERAQAVREAMLRAEYQAISAVTPPWVDMDLMREQDNLNRLRAELDSIVRRFPANHYQELRLAANELREAEQRVRHAPKPAEPPTRRWWNRTPPTPPPPDTSRQDRLDEARRTYEAVARPHLDTLDGLIAESEGRVTSLQQAKDRHAARERDHPDAGRRSSRIYNELQQLEVSRTHEQHQEISPAPPSRSPYPYRSIEYDNDRGRSVGR